MRGFKKEMAGVIAAICVLMQVQPVSAQESFSEDVIIQETDDEEVIQPEKVSGLKTTGRTKNSVYLEWEESENAVTYKIYRKERKKQYHFLTITENTNYVDNTIKTGMVYAYKVVAVNDEERSEETECVYHNTKIVNIRSQKYTYAQMEQDMQKLKKKYSAYCEMNVIGETVQGRNVYDFVIGKSDAENSLLVVSTLHAREYICSAVMMKEIEYYLENYNSKIGGVKPTDILKNTQIHYVVMANPDGVTISQTKNAAWKANGRGVDLNRNFPANPFIVGGKPGAQGYSGEKSLSEPETFAIAELTKQLKNEQNLLGVVNYHAMGQIIFGDCCKSSIKKDTNAMYQIARRQTGYRKAIDSLSKKSTGGQYREYVMDILNLPSITLEIGSSSAPCPYWQYETEFHKNKHVVIQIAKKLSE